MQGSIPSPSGASAATSAAFVRHEDPHEADAESEPSLLDLVEQVLREVGREHLAVVEGPRDLSYGLLDAISAAVANELADTEGAVAIALPRGTDAITAMIACIRSGRPFVPLSPDPGVQSTSIVAAAAAATVITDDVHAHHWTGYRVLTVPSSPSAAAPVVAARAQPGLPPPGGLGYLLTTSGTSGPPKLVRGSARGLARFLRWQREELQLGPGDVLSNTAQPWFDFSFKETLGAIVAGATVAVAPTETLTAGGAFLDWLAEARPTTVCLLPSRLAALVAAMERAGAQDATVQVTLHRLRWLLVSGEPFTARLFERWRALAPLPTVLNLYGPTESTVIKLRNVLPPSATVSSQTVPVGSPIPGAHVELLPLDDSGAAVDGAAELCLISDDLALGYVSQASGQTRFDHDRAGRPRLRTGDLARMTPDGKFELVGRMDHVVKRRGVKVSLPAIETAAQALPNIDTAAAVVCRRAGNAGEVDAVVLFCGTSRDIDSIPLRLLRAELLDRLGTAMMPDLIRVLPQIPLDDRGKVDRAALRELASVPGTQADGCPEVGTA
jgi:non-ribosomal peptide synthetase component F